MSIKMNNISKEKGIKMEIKQSQNDNIKKMIKIK